MNRLILVRHGGSTANEVGTYYDFADSAVCLTDNGVRQALNTGAVLATLEPRWLNPGNFALEAFVSEYSRAQQTARIVLDQMRLRTLSPRIDPLLNERDYGTKYDKAMDLDPYYAGHDSESSAQARPRARAFLDRVEALLGRADVIAFSHMGLMRALIAEILGLDDQAMMQRDIANGAAFLFKRVTTGPSRFEETTLAEHVLKKDHNILPPPVPAPPIP